MLSIRERHATARYSKSSATTTHWLKTPLSSSSSTPNESNTGSTRAPYPAIPSPRCSCDSELSINTPSKKPLAETKQGRQPRQRAGSSQRPEGSPPRKPPKPSKRKQRPQRKPKQNPRSPS